ncbi:hypothetical protein TVAG_036410 [Trichomonas vaginalis G3]|uniref:Integrase catalytic domain-containing protein n=1 Tax=Trichomonas vaginalis (strain ATCC PRA-98 / G3) TaxID=412133 RepID=A2DAW2_TRIV3|nr:hypothetical protein TVAG_036410 [Trichomonas vaginalis G3]|eukprot:XP_001583601.1 hypothetical protein [Trichomonas vaginalis G3]
MTEGEFEKYFNEVYAPAMKKERIEKEEDHNPWSTTLPHGGLTKKEEKKKTFEQLLDELIKTADRELTYEELMDKIKDFPPSPWDSNEIYQQYLQGIENRKDITRIKRQIEPIPIPFRTKSKQAYLIIDDKFPYLKNEKYLVNSFPKSNRQYYLHSVSPHGLFIIDLMFNGAEVYLIAIENNTRKLYVEPTNLINDGNYESLTQDKRNTCLYLNALEKIIRKGADIKALKGDGEGAFNSDKSKKFYKNNGITFIPVERIRLITPKDSYKTDPYHHSRAIVDRAIRTLRDMAFNVRKKLNPTLMQQLVDVYNNTPHSTLSKIMNFPLTPNQVAGDIELENEIFRRIKAENFNVIHKPGYDVGEGSKVYVLEDYDTMAKKRLKVKQDIWRVEDYVNGWYQLRNENTGEKIKRTRAYINPLHLF